MKKYIALIMIIVLMFCSGCVEKKSKYIAAEHNIKEYIVYNINRLPEDLIMFNNSEVRQKDLLPALFQGLVIVDDKGDIVPALAKKVEISKDKTTYVFQLREEAVWSDGSDISAKDVVDFFSKALNSKMGSLYASELYCIYGVEEYNFGKKDFNAVSIIALNDKTLQIKLNYPCDSLLSVLSQPEFCLRKIDNKLVDWKNKYRNILYTGPYRIEKVSGNNEITMLRNDKYWDKDEIKSSKIVITAVEGGEKALIDYENGKINVMVEPPLGEVERLIEADEASMSPVCSGTAIVFNLKKEGLTSDVYFRKAVSSIINRRDICDTVLCGTAAPAATFVPTNIVKTFSKEFGKLSAFAQEDEAAKGEQLFSQTKDYNKKKIKLVYLESIRNKKICDAITKIINFKGVYCYSKGYSSEELKKITKAGEYDMLLVDYNGLYEHAAAFLSNYKSKAPGNFSGYSSVEYDNTLIKIKFEKDESKQKSLLKDAEEILMRDLPVIPLYFDNVVLCKKDEVKGIYVTERGTIRLDRAYLELR